MAKTPQPCVCGCRELTKGGEFRPGHDMRHKSRLVSEVQAGGNDEALQELKARGWMKALNQARTKSRPKTATEIDMGPQHAIDVLAVMKAACRRLKLSNQYRRGTLHHITVDAFNMLQIVAGELPELQPSLNGEFTLDDTEREAFDRLCKQGV